MRGIMGAMAGGGVLLLAIGFGIGYLVFQPTIDSLRGTEDEQRRELGSAKSQLSQRTQAVEDLLTQLGEVRAERAGLDAELGAASASLDKTSASLEVTGASLKTLEDDYATTTDALTTLEAQAAQLRERVQSLDTAQQGLNAAIQLQADITAIAIQRLRPALGDGELLAHQAVRATQSDNYANAVIYFNNASEAYQTAETEMAETTSKHKELMELVPPDLHSSFNSVQKQYEARLRAVRSRVPEYQAAAKLHTVIDEWLGEDGPGSAEQLLRWEQLSNEGEELIQEALDLLEEADEWAPNLWREFEAQRIEIRDWQALLDGIRFFILDQ